MHHRKHIHLIDVSSYARFVFSFSSFLDYIHIETVMSSKVCKCGGTEIDTDPRQGLTVCMKCGEVIEDTSIVNETELTETSGGGIQVVGQYLSNDEVRGASAGGMMGFNIRESRQITLQKARRGIMDIASNMRMNHHCVDAAFKVRRRKILFSLKKQNFVYYSDL